MVEEHVVAVVAGVTGYPLVPPFDPPNPVYTAVLELLARLGLDRERVGTPEWNPLGAFVREGQHVVIKPNLVSSRNFHQRYGFDDFLCCCTHPSVIRPLVDLAWRAVGPRGKISIAEAPLEGSDLVATLAALGLPHMIEVLRARAGIDLELIDLREFRIIPKMLLDNRIIFGRSLNVGVLRREGLPGDFRGYTTIDLGSASAFADLDRRCGRLRFHHSNPGLPSLHHEGGRHEYTIPNTILSADLIVSVPKMKTHKKTGVTLSLKNMIGAAGQKYWLPHFTAGAAPNGDEYPMAPPLTARIATFLSRVTLPGGHAFVLRFPVANEREQPYIYDGNWSGNDTLWRTILDVNRIALYADKRGGMRQAKQRSVLSVVDGVIAGEGNGPLAPSPKRCRLLVAGVDAWACDYVTTRMMGVQPERIGFLSEAARSGPYPLTHLTAEMLRISPVGLATLRFEFALPRGWVAVRAPAPVRHAAPS